ncbi:hypothetical protein JTE90_006699 [Oedothorax gibbosus]|uniref:Uncharacterized protein n=1 Tax=Oedothorax gibbosus TaxID=931172 RepID=A0AAV6TVV0_9ARAC|nr:hypothetical protein JTE90_006699 [Oedothorax gibbosus]
MKDVLNHPDLAQRYHCTHNIHDEESCLRQRFLLLWNLLASYTIPKPDHSINTSSNTISKTSRCPPIRRSIYDLETTNCPNERVID